MNIIVKMSTYATRKDGTSKDCSNLLLTSKGWVAKYGSIKSVARQADEPNLQWSQPTVVFSMTKAEMSAANKALGPSWQIDTLYLHSPAPFSTKSLEDCVDFDNLPEIDF